MIPLIFDGLPYLEVLPNSGFAFMVCNWAAFTLLLDNQISQIIGLNVRALKVGLSLAEKLCQTSADIVEHFSTLNLADNLLQILSANHVASTIKISAIHVLDSLTDWPLQMYDFMFGTDEDSLPKSYKSNSQITGYTKIIKLCLQSQTARVAAALNQIVRKVHIYECMHEVQLLTQSIVLEKIPEEYTYISEEEEEEEEIEYSNQDEAEIGIGSSSPVVGMNDDEVILLSLIWFQISDKFSFHLK